MHTELCFQERNISTACERRNVALQRLLLSSFTWVIYVSFSFLAPCRGAPFWDVQEWILLSRNG